MAFYLFLIGKRTFIQNIYNKSSPSGRALFWVTTTLLFNLRNLNSGKIQLIFF